MYLVSHNSMNKQCSHIHTHNLYRIIVLLYTACSHNQKLGLITKMKEKTRWLSLLVLRKQEFLK